MITTFALGLPMSAEEAKSQSIRIPMPAIEAARIASSYQGKTLMDYLGEIILEVANWDIENGHRDYRSKVPAPTEPPRSRRPKKPKGAGE